MKKKFGTVIDEDLIFRAKKAALAQQQALSQVLENALKMYLDSFEKQKSAGDRHICEKTRASMKISPSSLKAIMEEEGVYETQ